MAPVTRSTRNNTRKLVFLFHGFPNGPIFFKDLIAELSKDPNVNCVVMNTRTGLSVKDNYNNMLELFDTYAGVEAERIIVAHDWGAVMVNQLLRHLAKLKEQKKEVPTQLEFDKVVTMSIPLKLVPINFWEDGIQMGIGRWYQVYYGFTYLLSHLPFIGRPLSNLFIGHTPFQSDGPRYQVGLENYYYFHLVGFGLGITSLLPKSMVPIKWAASDVLPLKENGTKFLYFRGTVGDNHWNNDASDKEMRQLGDVYVIDANHWFLRSHPQQVIPRIKSFVSG
eukprot:Clim_evm3s236 gene=Clim_evmTU3s236